MEQLQWLLLFVMCVVIVEVTQNTVGINDAIDAVTKARMWSEEGEESRSNSPDESLLVGETSGEVTTPVGTCSKGTVTTTASSCMANITSTCEGADASLEQLREQMMTLTNKLSIQVAEWNIAQQLQRKWELLEREKAR